MIFIIGVCHLRQHGLLDNESVVNEFTVYIKSFVKERKIVVIAEESSLEYLDEKALSKTPTQVMCDSLNIKHIFADPNRNERRILGIRGRNEIAKDLGIYRSDEKYTPDEINKINLIAKPYDKLREKEWLKRIGGETDKQVIFVCGKDHVKTLTDLLEKSGIQTEIAKVFK